HYSGDGEESIRAASEGRSICGGVGESEMNPPVDSFLMPIEDVFSVKNTKGFVLVGPVQRGTLLKGQEVEIIGLRETSFRFSATDLCVPGMGAVTGREQLSAGDYGGIFLTQAHRDKVERGMVVVAPGSMQAHKAIIGNLTLLSAEEGGRTEPIEF